MCFPKYKQKGFRVDKLQIDLYLLQLLDIICDISNYGEGTYLHSQTMLCLIRFPNQHP